MTKSIAETLLKLARDWGAEDLRVVQGGKHPRLVGNKEGLAFMLVTPSTASDWRAEKNCIAELRRILGVRREKGVSVEKRRRRRGGRKASRDMRTHMAPIAKPQPDRFHEPLKQLRAEMTAEARTRRVPLRTPFLGPQRRYAAVENNFRPA